MVILGFSKVDRKSPKPIRASVLFVPFGPNWNDPIEMAQKASPIR